ncbi:MAG TPA: hypothetical protein VHB45_13065 [Alloacidobacterium sp.]|nr:hypothetical protein [Alloacidobacterium sp.]
MAQRKKDRHWERTGSIVAYTDWLRKESGALAVIVMRAGDGALSVDDAIAPKDVEDMMLAHLQPLVEDLAQARQEKRGKAARLSWKDVGGE